MSYPTGQSRSADPGLLTSQTLGLGELEPSGTIRILVIDDEDSTCALIRAALSNKDFEVASVSDPAQIKPHLQSRRKDDRKPDQDYHLVLLDYVLPGVEPDQVFGWLREFQPDSSVIVVTGYPSVDSALSSLRARAFDYITKPFQIQQLREVVLRCLETRGLLRMSEKVLRESLGAAIRDRRKALGMTLQQMANKTDVSLGYLSQIELGKNSASIETLYKICLALGIRMADLFEVVQKPSPH